MKRKKTPETSTPETSMTPETLETSDVSYVAMQDMYEGSVQRSSWLVRGIAVWQQPSWSATLSMSNKWLVQPSHRVIRL